MKRTDLIRMMERNGWRLLREGGSHSIMTNGYKVEPIPRHTEIDERMARSIIKRWRLK